jgi:hypothetical protein
MSGPKRISRLQPRNRITPEAVAAFKAKDWTALHLALGLKPWEMNPLDVHKKSEPSRDNPSPWFQSWWKVRRLRKELEAAAARRN